MTETELTNCPVRECAVLAGARHSNNCSIARCKEHGQQFISCDSNGSHTPSIFKGEYPGTSEAIQRGWFVKLVEGKGWIECGKDDPGAKPDLNRVMTDLVWNSDLEKFSK